MGRGHARFRACHHSRCRRSMSRADPAFAVGEVGTSRCCTTRTHTHIQRERERERERERNGQTSSRAPGTRRTDTTIGTSSQHQHRCVHTSSHGSSPQFRNARVSRGAPDGLAPLPSGHQGHLQQQRQAVCDPSAALSRSATQRTGHRTNNPRPSHLDDRE